MAFFGGGGFNPGHGRDGGDSNPGAGGPGGLGNGGFGPPGQFPDPWCQLYYQQSLADYAIMLANRGGGFPNQPPMNTAFAPSRPFYPPPHMDPNMPAVHLTNTTGGVGCEPGYNYFFPAEHTKVLVFLTGSNPPWQLPRGFQATFHAMTVPSNVTVAELLKGCGATNPNPKMNKVHEVIQGTNGMWYRGLTFSGDEKEGMKTRIKDIGWDMSRTGFMGQKPVVYLYITKD